MVVIDDHDAVVVSRLDEEDQATEVVYVNDTYTRLAGFKLNEVYGGPLGTVVGAETDRVALQALVDEFARAGISEEELTLHGRDGSPFRVRIRLQAVPSPERRHADGRPLPRRHRAAGSRTTGSRRSSTTCRTSSW